MKQIEAKIIADSLDGRGNRLTTYILTYPRMIHAEVMTHRLFSRNAASSRAIPFDKMVKMVEEDPFIPIAWQKDHKGMQGLEYITSSKGIKHCTNLWLMAKDQAVESAKRLRILSGDSEYPGTIEEVFSDFGEDEDILLTKQFCNRLLEPFMWYTALVTASEFDNFFKLRCPQYLVGKFSSKKDAIKFANTIAPGRLPDIEDTLAWLKVNQSPAEIHIQALAEAMWDARNESTPKELKPGEWHIPFGDQMESEMIYFYAYGGDHQSDKDLQKEVNFIKLKIATARCARLSYMTHDGVIDYGKDIALHDQLLSMKHLSPFEHCAQMMSEEEYFAYAHTSLEKPGEIDWDLGWCNNLRGFIPYRYIIENK